MGQDTEGKGGERVGGRSKRGEEVVLVRGEAEGGCETIEKERERVRKRR